MFSLICALNKQMSSINYREAGDLRCHRAHYDVIVMIFPSVDAESHDRSSEMKLLIISQASAVAPFIFENEYILSSHTLYWMLLLIHAGDIP